MNAPIYSQRVMESAVEIAYMAGAYGFQTPNSRDMMSDFVAWAVEFEKLPYEDDDWMELIDSFAVEMMVIEIERGRACHIGDRAPMQSIHKPKNLAEWESLKDADWVYLPEHGERILTKGHFVKLCEGNVVRAHQLYGLCEWQAPETIIDESGGLEKMFAEDAA